jgi:hypothetical protein
LRPDKEISTALRAILAEGADVERTAALCDLTPTEVRQLTRRHANGRTARSKAAVSRPAPMRQIDEQATE